MSNGKIFFIDTTRCTACRGCQVACKEWQGFAGNKTTQIDWGSHQNPPDLNALNYKVVRFRENKDKTGRVRWNFFPDQCRHCIEPPCKDAADEVQKGVVTVDPDTGAVLYSEDSKSFSKEAFENMVNYCSYNVPRRSEATGVINKCDMCINRVSAGLIPMCVKTCPTGAMNFGDRDEMLALARKRLEVVKKDFPEAQLLGEDTVRVVYLINDKPDNYHENIARINPGRSDIKIAAVKKPSLLGGIFRELMS